MNEKTIRALIEAGAVKRIRIIANGSQFHVDIEAGINTHTVCTLRGSIKTWSTLDASAKWVHSLGIGKAEVDLTKWYPGQRGLDLPLRANTEKNTTEVERNASNARNTGFDF